MKRGIAFIIKTVLIILVLGLFIVFLVPIKSNTIAHIMLSPIEKKLQKDIEFGDSYIWLPRNISLVGASIIDESGRLYYCNTFDLKYNLADVLFRKREFFFNLKGIKLYQNVEFLDFVADMLVISKMPDIEFREIEGVLQLHKNAFFLKDVYAYNDKMRIRGSGWVDNDGSLDCNINFSFSKDVTDIIPDAVKTALLTYEGEGWMGIALKVKGNYKKPTLHISGDTLKLNIMEGLITNE